MANDNDMVVRQVGLTFALLASPAKRDVTWVQKHVDGYGGRTRDAATHLIERDVRELRDLGVPARYQDGEVWVVKDLYELPAVDLTAEEASVVGLAADLSKPGSLGEFARSGWTKLAASGATRSMDAPALMNVSNDIFQLRPDTLRAIVKCVQAKQRISFDFVRAPGKDPERRVADPWGVVSLNNRAYFVGYDIDRDDVRVFRLKKISKLKKVRHSDAFHERASNLQALVRSSPSAAPAPPKSAREGRWTPSRCAAWTATGPCAPSPVSPETCSRWSRWRSVRTSLSCCAQRWKGRTDGCGLQAPRARGAPA